MELNHKHFLYQIMIYVAMTDNMLIKTLHRYAIWICLLQEVETDIVLLLNIPAV